MSASYMLNPAQEAAVRHRGSSLLVLAGAGTGKTRVITHRVVSLLEEGVWPSQILAVTFTNKAAAEMRSRIATLCAEREICDADEVRRMPVGTFHSIGSRLLRRFGESVGLSRQFSIYDTSDQRTLMKRELKALHIDNKVLPANAALSWIDKARNRALPSSQLHQIIDDDEICTLVRRAWVAYEKSLRDANAVDFGQLLTLALKLVRGAREGEYPGAQDYLERLRYVVVDEYQDTNPVQSELVDLFSKTAELCVVGDDDQSIYGWRGAEVDLILRFPERHSPCEVVRLEQNYRSTSHILRCAGAVIHRNQTRMGKELWGDQGDGEAVLIHEFEDEGQEARFVAQRIRLLLDEGADPKEIAVFYRTHAQSRPIEEAFRQQGLQVRMVGGTRFFDRAEIKDLVAYLRLLVSRESDVDLLRVINQPARGIGAKTIEKLSVCAQSNNCSLFAAISQDDLDLSPAAKRKVEAFRDLIEGIDAETGGEFVAAQSAASDTQADELSKDGEPESKQLNLLEVRESAEEDEDEGLELQQVSDDPFGMPLDELVELVLERSGLRERLAAEADIESQSRLENLQEFVGAIAEYSEINPGAGLADYLEWVSLSTSEDRPEGSDRDEAITLMTVHTAKGLEFDHVFLTGMEEGVFPHARSYQEDRGLEEERRLAYVAFTRARQRLTISYVRCRRLYGQREQKKRSHLIQGLPPLSVVENGCTQTGSRGRLSSRAQLHFGESERSDRDREVDNDWDDDIELEPEFGGGDEVGEGAPLYIGMRVRHPKFGVGKVIGWSGMGDGTKLKLSFAADVGARTVLARFCQPL